MTGIAFSILIGQYAAHSLHYCGSNDVFGCNQFDFVTLAVQLRINVTFQLRINYAKFFQIHFKSLLKIKH